MVPSVLTELSRAAAAPVQVEMEISVGMGLGEVFAHNTSRG